MAYAIGDVENMGKRYLRHTLGAVGWDIGHRNAKLAGSLQVNSVVAGGEYADIFQLRQLLEQFGVHEHLIGQYDFRITDTTDDLLRL